MKVPQRMRYGALLFSFAVMLGCDYRGGKTSSVSTIEAEGGLHALQRQPGQKDYLNLVQTWDIRARAADARGRNESFSEPAAAPGGAPLVLEADEYSLVGDRLIVAHKGKGLSVVTGLKRNDEGTLIDYDEVYQVPDKNALTHSAKVLYQWPENDFLVVIGNGDAGDNARLVDVSKGGKGYFAEQALPGSVLDHRLVTVGKEGVLYVASAVDGKPGESQKGALTSYAVSADGFKLVSSLAVDRAIAQNEVMKIASTVVDNVKKFFLIAPLASHWSVVREGSTYSWKVVEGGLVHVDISDVQGKFGQVTELPAAGTVIKREFTAFDAGRLDVVSQSSFAGAPAIAVEQADLTEAKEVVSEEEANKRLVEFDKAMTTAYEKALEEKRAAHKDPNAQLTRTEKSTVYVQKYKDLIAQAKLSSAYIQKEDRLVKVKMNWSEYIVGPEDISRPGATVQDVRFLNNLVYVTWVPTNEIDPVSIYERGSAGKNPRKVGDVAFEKGFFQRTLPFIAVNPATKEEEFFIIGYGLEPAAQNEQGFRPRIPMVRVYRLQKRVSSEGDEFEKVEVAHQLVGDGTVQFNNREQDRYTYFQFDPLLAKANLLIEASRVTDDQYQKGGVYVSFDMSKYFASANSKGLVQVSPFLVGTDLDQIFRVFYSGDSAAGDTVATLGNNATFFAGPKDGKNAFGSLLATIELVKTITWFESIGLKDEAYGIQFLAKSSVNQGHGFEARLVALDKVNASKKEAIHTGTFVPGQFLAQQKLANGDLVVLSFHVKTVKENDELKSVYTAYLTTLKVAKDKEGKPALKALTVDRSFKDYIKGAKIAAVPNDDSGALVVVSTYAKETAGLWLKTKDAVTSLNLEDGYTLAWTEDTRQSVVDLEGKLYLVVSKDAKLRDAEKQDVGIAKEGDVSYKIEQYFLMPFEVEDGEVSLGRAFNIPGKPLAQLQGKYLLTDDSFAASATITKEMKLDQNNKPVLGDDGKPKYVSVLSGVKLATQYTLVSLTAGAALYQGGHYDVPADEARSPIFFEGPQMRMPMRYVPIQRPTVSTANGDQFLLLKRGVASKFVTLKVGKTASLTEQTELNISSLFSDENESQTWSIVRTFARKGKDDLVVLASSYPSSLTVASVDKKGLVNLVKVERTNGDYEESSSAIRLGQNSYVQPYQLQYSDETGLLNVVDTEMAEVRQYKLVD